MKKILGIFGLLVCICVVTTMVNRAFLEPVNIENLLRWTALFGFISIGVSFVIITGGIDLSIGSVIGLTGCLLAMFLEVSFEPTGNSFTVSHVEVGEKQITLVGDSFRPGIGDRLQFSSSTGRARTYTVKAFQAADGNMVVTVNEPLRLVKASQTLDHYRAQHMSIPLALLLVLAISGALGLIHGLLITKLKLQPFVVTLCGLLFYRGLSRYITEDQLQGFGTGYKGLKYMASGKLLEGADWLPFAIPIPMVILIFVAILASLMLNYSIYGRYMLALGRNEQAARYSGINTDRMVIMAYVICSLLAGVSGILFALDLNSIQPNSHGNFYELYAIAAAVLGGCSLRGGEGTIIGVLIGTAVMRVLYNSINLMGIDTQLEFAIIGMVILIGVIVDELVKRVAARHRAQAEAASAE